MILFVYNLILKGELFSKNFDFELNYTNKNNQWYWTSLTKSVTNNLDYHTNINCPFNIQYGNDPDYNIKTLTRNITINYDSNFKYKKLPIQLTPWKDCEDYSYNTCEGIKMESKMFEISYNSNCNITNNYSKCNNFSINFHYYNI